MDAVHCYFYTSLNNIIGLIRKVNVLLANDQEHFKKNAISAITLSNHAKTQILAEMGEQLKLLQSYIPVSEQGLPQTLSQYILKLDKLNADKVQLIVSSLHNHLADGYQNLVNNSHIVNENLGFMHNVWEKLMNLSQQNTGVYTKPDTK